VLRGDTAAFHAMVTPHLGELLQAAKRELRYRVALGDIASGDLSAEELVGEVFIRAWQDRRRRPLNLGVRAWLLALIFRVARDIARREGRFKKTATVSLDERAPDEPVYDDDESFWDWYQPDDLTRWEDIVEAPTMSPEDVAVEDEELTRSLDPREREAFLFFELHRSPLTEVAIALGLSVAETARLIEDARRRLGVGGEKQMP
jgi:RNA polymerase sigma-70 factor (ECF subfamily)